MSAADLVSEFNRFFDHAVYDTNFEGRLKYLLHRCFPVGSPIADIINFLNAADYSPIKVHRSPHIIAYERTYPVVHRALQHENAPAATVNCRITIHVDPNNGIDDIRTRLRVIAP